MHTVLALVLPLCVPFWCMLILVRFTLFPSVIRIDIPALTDLLAFLRENSQQEIDAAAAQISQATDRLNKSASTLDEAILKEKNT